MTEKLYYIDRYMKTCEAIVTEVTKTDEKFLIVLDKTCFYPEGGGQLYDIGTISNATISEVFEKDGTIYHKSDISLTVGESVKCVIDWERRYKFMQNHSGEHIISGIVKKHYGFNNVGFHLSENYMTIDFDGELSQEDLSFIEKKANAFVYENRPIIINSFSQEEAAKIDYRSKKALSGDIRIVEIPEVDLCACCGTHTASTGEIGIIKFINSQKYKGGVRLTILCGTWALEDYTAKNALIHKLSSKLSAKPDEVDVAVDNLLSELQAKNEQIFAVKNNYFELIANQFDNSEKAIVFEENLTPDELRRFCLLLSEKANVAFAFSPVDSGSFKYAIGSKSTDVREINKNLLSKFNAKGGGNNLLVQGTVFCGYGELVDYLNS